MKKFRFIAGHVLFCSILLGFAFCFIDMFVGKENLIQLNEAVGLKDLGFENFYFKHLGFLLGLPIGCFFAFYSKKQSQKEKKENP